MKCSPQPPDICGTLAIGDLKLLGAHIFHFFMFAHIYFVRNLTRLCDSPRVENQVWLNAQEIKDYGFIGSF